MKKLIKALLIVVLFATTTNCSDENSTSVSSTENTSNFSTTRMSKLSLDDLVDQPEIMGDIHNEALDYVYYQLAKLSDEQVEELNIEDFVKSQTINFMNDKFEVEDLSVGDYITYDDWDETADTNVTSFYNEITDLIDTANSPASFYTDAESKHLTYLNLSNDDLYTLKIKWIYSIAIKSYEYWHDTANIAKWSKSKPVASVSPTVKADVKGAVKGLAWGSKNVPPTTSNYHMIVVTSASASAIAASAWSGITNFFK